MSAAQDALQTPVAMSVPNEQVETAATGASAAAQEAPASTPAMSAPEGQAKAEASGVIVSFRRPRARPFMKKIIDSIGGKTVDEAIAEREARKLQIEAELQEVTAMQNAQTAQVEEAKVEFDQAQAEVDAEIKKEIAEVGNLRNLRETKDLDVAKTLALRSELFEAQKKLALLEVLEITRAKSKALAEQAQAAAKAAEDAKKEIAEQKKIQRQALAEAFTSPFYTRKRAFAKLDVKGSKRAARATACDEEEAEAPSKLQKLDELSNVSAAPTVVQTLEAQEKDIAETLVDDVQLPESLSQVGA